MPSTRRFASPQAGGRPWKKIAAWGGGTVVALGVIGGVAANSDPPDASSASAISAAFSTVETTTTTTTTTASPTPTGGVTAGAGAGVGVGVNVPNVPRTTTRRAAVTATTRRPAPPKTTTARKTTTEKAASAHYANCAAVRAAGKAPIHRSDPGYSRALDRDGDGVGCAGD